MPVIVVHHCLLVLTLLLPNGFSFSIPSSPQAQCRVEPCSNWFDATNRYENLDASPSRHCHALATFQRCLVATKRFCHGNLRFHSTLLVVRREMSRLRCDALDLHKIAADGNRCYFEPPPMEHKIKMCSLFGDPHLLRFDGTFQMCSEAGARPLINNRYFLIQVTNGNVRNAGSIVSKVTVLFRKHNCTNLLVYQASSEEQHLARGFSDGSTSSSIRLEWVDGEHVELHADYIRTIIIIRRQGPYLGVTVRAPSNVLEAGKSSTRELCWHGCDGAACIARSHGSLQAAKDRCLSSGTTDNFLDACVFDLLATGDQKLAVLANLTRNDVLRNAPNHFLQHLVRNRTEMSFDIQLCNFSASCRNFIQVLAVFAILILFGK